MRCSFVFFLLCFFLRGSLLLVGYRLAAGSHPRQLCDTLGDSRVAPARAALLTRLQLSLYQGVGVCLQGVGSYRYRPHVGERKIDHNIQRSHLLLCKEFLKQCSERAV